MPRRGWDRRGCSPGQKYFSLRPASGSANMVCSGARRVLKSRYRGRTANSPLLALEHRAARRLCAYRRLGAGVRGRRRCARRASPAAPNNTTPAGQARCAVWRRGYSRCLMSPWVADKAAEATETHSDAARRGPGRPSDALCHPGRLNNSPGARSGLQGQGRRGRRGVASPASAHK